MRPVWLMLASLVLVSCTPAVTPPPASGVIEVRVLASPVCPVETVPPDPACQPRPVAGAPIVVTAADGDDVVVAKGASDASGMLRLAVPPGSYILTGGEVNGLMGLPPPTPVTVGSEPVSVTLTYDTGIR